MILLRDAGEKHTNNCLKIVAILGFGLTIPALFLLTNSPAEGYELSIYSATPTAAWVCVIASLCSGLFITIHQAFAKEKSSFGLIGIFLVVLAIFTILVIPALRGYLAFWGDDPSNHIAETRHILMSGHFGEGNFYPVTHVIIAMVSKICDMLPTWALGYFGPFMSVLFILSTYLFAGVVLPERGQVLLAVAASTILFYGTTHTAVYPHTTGLFMLPWLFYFYVKDLIRPLWQNRLCLALLLMCFTFTYPPVSLAVTCCLAFMALAKWLWSKRLGFSQVIGTNLIYPAFISFIMSFLWASAFPAFRVNVRNAWGWLGGEVMIVPRIAATQERLASLGTLEMIELALKQYGDSIILVLLSLVAVILVIKRISQAEMWRPLLATVTLIPCGVLSLVIFRVSTSVTIGRLLGLNYVMWVTPILAGFCLYELFHKKSRLRTAGVTAILVILSLVSVSGLYTSPYINQASPHVTYMDREATSWVTDHGTPLYTVTAMGYNFRTLANITGAASRTPQGRTVYRIYPHGRYWIGIPDHFGYSERGSLAESVSERFLIITKGFEEVSILQQPGY